MGIVLLGLLVVLILFGLGFVAHVLLWVAVIALIIWGVGFLARGTNSAGSRGRWYRW